MSNHPVTRKRSHSLGSADASFVEDISRRDVQSLGTTGFGGRKVHVPGERGERARSYSDGDMLGERNPPQKTFPQHNLLHRHDAHHNLSANKVNIAEEKSKFFSQRFKFSSMNPLPAMYKAAKRVGQFFKATASGFFSGVTKIVGMKWSTDNQWQQTQKSHFSEADSERESLLKKVSKERPQAEQSKEELLEESTGRTENWAKLLKEIRNHVGENNFLESDSKRDSLFELSEEDLLGLPTEQEISDTRERIKEIIKRKEKAAGPIQEVKPLPVGEDDYNPAETEARAIQGPAVRENIAKHQREAIPLTLSAKEKADLDEHLKEARSMGEYQKGTVAMRNPSFVKNVGRESEELHVTNEEVQTYARLKEEMERERRERPPRPDITIERNTSSLREMEAKRKAHMKRLEQMVSQRTLSDVIKSKLNPIHRIKPITTDENQPISDRGIIEL